MYELAYPVSFLVLPPDIVLLCPYVLSKAVMVIILYPYGSSNLALNLAKYSLLQESVNQKKDFPCAHPWVGTLS